MSEGKRNGKRDRKVNRVRSTLNLIDHFKDNIKVTMFRYNMFFILKFKRIVLLPSQKRGHILECDFALWEECAEHEHVIVNTKF